MKYLVRYWEDTSISTKLPLPALLESVEATRPYMDELRRKEKIVDWGFYGAGHGFYAVMNVKSVGELHELTELTPARVFCKIECDPILDGSEFSDIFGKIKTQHLATYERMNRDIRQNNR